MLSKRLAIGGNELNAISHVESEEQCYVNRKWFEPGFRLVTLQFEYNEKKKRKWKDGIVKSV